MAQISYGSITVSDVTDIENVYFEYALAKSDASETSIKNGTYTFSQTGERGWSTTYPTWTRGYQVWIREVKKYANIDNVVTLTPYLDKAINDLNNIIDNIDIDSLQTKLKYIWVNTNNNSHPRGTYAASGREQESTPITFDIDNQSTYGFNTHLAHNALDLRYNDIKMTSLTTGALTFYVPMYKNGSYVQGGEGLILNANGLRLFAPYNYRLSEDTSLDPNKTYYTYSVVDSVPTYTVVTNPNPNPHQANYYEWTTAAVLNQNGLNITEGSVALGEQTIDYYRSRDSRINLNKDYYAQVESIDPQTGNTIITYSRIGIDDSYFIRVENPQESPSEQKWYEKSNNTYILTQDTDVVPGKNYYTSKVPKSEFFYEQRRTHAFEVTSDGYLNAQTGWVGGVESYVKIAKDEDAGTHYLDIRLSQLDMLLNSDLYGQENVIDVLDLISQQNDFIKLWNGETIWLYGTVIESPTGNPQENGYFELINRQYVVSEDTTVNLEKTYYSQPFYTVYQYIDNDIDKEAYYYNVNEYDEGTYELSTDTTIQDNTIYYKKTINNTSDNNIIEVTKYQDAKIDLLTASIEPIQFFNGYSKPWVGGTGKNKADISSAEVGTAWNGASNSARARLIIPCKASTTYTLSVNGTNNLDGINGTYSASIPASSVIFALNGTSVSFTTASDSAYITVGFNKSGITQNNLNALKLQVEEGSSKTSYAPYENICPISGHTDVVVSRTGKNLCDTSLVYNGYVNVSQQKIASNANARTLYLPCKPNTTYTVSKQAGQRFVVAESTELPTNNVVVSNIVSDYTASSITITTSASAYYLVAFVYLSTADTGVTEDQMLATCQIELGSTATTYEAYNGDTYTTGLGRTVYSGTLDVTAGVLTVDRVSITYDGSNDEAWQYYSVAQGNLFRITQRDRKAGTIYPLGVISNRFETVANANRRNGTMSSPTSGSEYALDFIYDNCNSVATWKTWLSSNNIQVVYPLAEPLKYILMPQQIELLTGINNLWVDSGDINVEVNLDYEAITPISNPSAEGCYELEFNDIEWTEYTDDIELLPAIQLAGLGQSLKFSEDSLGNQQKLIVSSSRRDEEEKLTIEIDPQFVNFAIRGEEIAPLQWKLGYKNDLTNISNPNYGYLDITYGDETIFTMSDPNNYFLETSTGFKMGPLGLFHYKDGLAIGIV